MKKSMILFLSILSVLLFFLVVVSKKRITSKVKFNYSIRSTNEINNFDEWKKNATEVMRDTYPFIVSKFNLKKRKGIIQFEVVIDDIPEYTKIVVEDGKKKIIISSEHIRKRRVDSYTGLAYHLATYFLQDFKKNPFWLYSGLASYIRCYVKKGNVQI